MQYSNLVYHLFFDGSEKSNPVQKKYNATIMYLLCSCSHNKCQAVGITQIELLGFIKMAHLPYCISLHELKYMA